MKVVDAASVAYREYLHPREGRVDLKILVSGECSPGVNFTLALTRYGRDEAAFKTPRHRHTFGQVRYALDSASNYARGKDIPVGCVGYFPEGAFYGPQLVSGGEILLLQYGPGYLTEEQKRKAQLEMAELGEFHDGIYSTTDADGKRRNKDAVQALWEYVHGGPEVYPRPLYPEPIVMDPGAFDWAPLARGSQRKRLGAFGSPELTIDFCRVTSSGALGLGAGRGQLAFTTSGVVDVGGQRLGPGSALFSEFGETAEALGSPTCELLVIGLPGK